MGNCQATDAAAVVIQHADGRVERLYWPTSAGEVMRCNPGYYVALITFCFSGDVRDTAKAEASSTGGGGGVGPGSSLRLARARLLKHKDILLIGQVYRLVTSQEVTKALQARKHERTRKVQAEQMKKRQNSQQQRPRVEEGVVQLAKHERERQRSSRQWQPSLQSISEAGS
ncbi:hypothetical protein HPP92_016735 [Vanilla planifolia]|uniref:Uncharacterized protein n=1 Tax=Vanilla planifolia TaxID=51239 RepID=A0A835QGP2_VANPL|nr:hypothetical protein HPP92_017333 [Vanilla planifolia]KAG0472189.1 hypothetical protein HPP92_016735 [Vanilla planifolia]